MSPVQLMKCDMVITSNRDFVWIRSLVSPLKWIVCLLVRKEPPTTQWFIGHIVNTINTPCISGLQSRGGYHSNGSATSIFMFIHSWFIHFRFYVSFPSLDLLQQ